ncbi:type IVB secretion system protein IcmH/DotU [Methylobacterium sp. NFXW15]|uniref:type IVB secretion system protein IcmH/DotU n=1 Tax=Methylobacterium sp. NFXW15 TaxID=2819512 RepID=UPI003CF76135
MSASLEFDPPTVIGYRPARLSPPGGPGLPANGLLDGLDPASPRLPASTPPSAGIDATEAAAQADSGAPSPDALVAAASPLLTLVARLAGGVAQADVAKLRSEVIDRIYRFDEAAARTGAPPQQVQTARYILCALVDEAVMTTSWGTTSDWSTNSLLNRFHGETWGGENVFAILERAKRDPATNLPLLKLIEAALLLGFEGLYRVREDGRDRLDALREDLRHLLARHLPPPPAELSRGWRGTGADATLRDFLPLWIVFALAGFFLVCVYSYQRYRLAAEAAPVVATMQALERSAPTQGATP